MQGIILAAGMGKRLGNLTKSNTKCMVQVNGVALIDRVLHQLDRCNLSRIVIVVGFEGKKLMDYIATLNIHTPVCYVENRIYDKTNNIYSLALAREYLLGEDTLLLESDLIFEDCVLDALLDDPRETLALVDKYESWMDGTCIKVGEDDSIQAFIAKNNFDFNDIPEYYKTVNIYKFSRHFSEKTYVPFLEAYSKALGNNEYYEQVLKVVTMLEEPGIRAKKLNRGLWYEIDDIQDLDIASSMFVSDPYDMVAGIQDRYGGYWRYPHMTDFCYLVNPYYPPKKMMDEIKANFETLLTQYPSGLRVNSLLAAKNYNVRQEHILIGNGAAELIKSIMERFNGKIGLVRPTFEEYPNRCSQDGSVVFVPQNADFSYTADDLMDFFDGQEIDVLVLINPDNPSGNYISADNLLRLIRWCEEKNIYFLVDESFSDFAEEAGNTLINEEVISTYRKLIVIKSISKSHGVPGARLGILFSGDTSLIADLKKDVAIWNINSFGEFYMQIQEKYGQDYEAALAKLRETRGSFMNALDTISGLRVVPSQANYFMVEIINGVTARELTKILLDKYHLLIKDLSGKTGGIGQYVRIAVRKEQDNEKLICALREVFQGFNA